MLHILTWLMIGLLYSPVFTQLYRSRWELLDYTHAYFVLPVALVMVWDQRAAIGDILRKQPPAAKAEARQGLYLLPLCAGLFLFILGWRMEYLMISTLSVIPVLAGTAGYLYGGRVVRRLAFPLLYLLLLVPPPLGILDALTLPLRHGVSGAAVFVLQSLHLPAHREGLLIFLGDKELFMGPACSGFRSLATLFALALPYIYFTRAGVKKAVILLLWVVPLALAGNLARVLALCWVTYTFGEKAGQGVFHEASGLAVFILLIGGLMLIDNIIDDDGDDV